MNNDGAHTVVDRYWTGDEQLLEPDAFYAWLKGAIADHDAYVDGLKAKPRPEEAAIQGFRTTHHLNAAIADRRRALVAFSSEPFIRAWKALRCRDQSKPADPPLFGRHNGSAPARILDCVDHWHRTPKQSDAQSRRAHARIEKLSGQLIELLEQVSPGVDVYDRIRLSGVQSREVFRVFGSQAPPGRFEPTPFTASDYLRRAGVTPLSVLAGLRARAGESPPSDARLPRKIAAATAYRTYVIGVLARHLTWDELDLPISDTELAELAGLLTGKDCSADDVRKALHANRSAAKARATSED